MSLKSNCRVAESPLSVEQYRVPMADFNRTSVARHLLCMAVQCLGPTIHIFFSISECVRKESRPASTGSFLARRCREQRGKEHDDKQQLFFLNVRFHRRSPDSIKA